MRIFLLPALLLAVVHADEVSLEKLTAHVTTLASKEYEGRRGAGALKAEAYVKKAFLAAGLETTVREHKVADRGNARNVVGILQVGKEPSKEHVIVSAHYDHLGRWGQFVFPGAADNAAGVAAMLELARLLKPPLSRDVIFIAFDAEERGFIGSYGYTADPVRPLAQCAAFVTFDILGRNLADATEGMLFCVGTERSDTLFPAVRKAALPAKLMLVYAGADVVGARSDFVPFMAKKVPFLFFSAGEYRDYHRPTDTAARLDFKKLHRETRALVAIMRNVIAAPRARYLDEPALRIEEASTMAKLLDQLLADPKKLGLTAAETFMGKAFGGFLQQLVESGKMTKGQRQQLVSTCRMLTKMLSGKR